MAKDMQTKKRKASVPEVDAEKVKKAPGKNGANPTEPPAKKRKATEDAAPVKVKKTKTPKDVTEVKPTIPANTTTKKSQKSTTTTPNGEMEKAKEILAGVKEKMQKKDKKDKKDKKEVAPKPVANGEASTAAKKGKGKEIVVPTKPEIEADEELDSGLEDEDEEMEDDEEPDDQTKELLKGFEDDEDNKEEIDDGLEEGDDVPKRKKLSKNEEKKLREANAGKGKGDDKPGVVYVGRIPHGFFEHEMKQYFGQFGPILKLRLSRNKKTGASKHYAFIQFESAGVADIVAKTMDNYLMFQHLLKVKLIPDEQVNPDWFKGANKRFKRVPWTKMAGRKLEQPKSEEDWNKQGEREKSKRETKAKKMKEMGYEYEAPEIKSATGVGKPKAPEETNGEGSSKAVEDTPVEESSKPEKKGKKASKTEATSGPVPSVRTITSKKGNRGIVYQPPKEDVQESIDAMVAEKIKKGEKAKVVKETEVTVEETVTVVEEPSEPKSKKEKKSKKTDVAEAIAEPAVEAPAKVVKKKKSKASSMVETTVAPLVTPDEPVKKSKKRKASA